MKTDLEALKKSSVFAEEAFVVDVQSLLETIMHEKGMTRSQLADAMSVSRARVSQMFSSDCKNFTVRLLARALHAMGERAEMSCETMLKVRLREASSKLFVGTQRFESDWIFSWSGALPANDCGPALQDEIEVAGVDGERIAGLVGNSLRRDGSLHRAIA